MLDAKRKNVATAKAAPAGASDVWTWTAIDADTKLIVSYFVGDRSCESAINLMDNLRARFANDTTRVSPSVLQAPPYVMLRRIKASVGLQARKFRPAHGPKLTKLPRTHRSKRRMLEGRLPSA